MDKSMTGIVDLVLYIAGNAYPITEDTKQALMDGTIPDELNRRIRIKQGEEWTYDFGRQIHLMKQVSDQIRTGQLPAELSPLICSGKVPSEILHPLHKRKLVCRAEQLQEKKLLTEADVATIRAHLLTEEIIPALSRALLLDVAEYLYRKHEINHETLSGFYDGSIDLFLIKVIRRHYRAMKYGDEVSDKYHLYPLSTFDDFDDAFLESIPNHLESPEETLARKRISEKLTEAISWLTPDEQKLISDIYDYHKTIKAIAAERQVAEKTIRYRRDNILNKLRFVLEDVMNIDRDSLRLY